MHDVHLHNLDLERAVLGPCICHPRRALPQAQEWLGEAAFFDPRHRALWNALLDYLRAGCPEGDRILFFDFLALHGAWEAVGGSDYVASILMGFDWDWANVGSYAQQVARYAQRRGYVAAGDAISQEAQGGDPDQDIAERAATILKQVPAAGGSSGSELHEDLPDFCALDPERLYGPAAKCGISSLDYAVPLHGPKFVVVGARPGHGKTALAMTYTVTTAVAQKRRVVFYALEQEPVMLKINFLSQLTGLPATKIARGELPPEQREQLNVHVRDLLKSFQVTFVNAAGWTVERIVAHAEAQAAVAKPGLVVVDHMNLIRLPLIGQRNGPQTKQEAMAAVSADFKRLSLSIGCPVMALTQFNRAGATEDKRPTTAAIRDTGMIEADADVILLPYRPKAGSGGAVFENDVEIIVAKNKNDAPGRIECGFNPPTMKFVARRETASTPGDDERGF